jgi:acyl-CoA dehydrogenase
MDFELPPDLVAYLQEFDEFIALVIKPLEEGDNVRSFDHRREDARADWHRGGLPHPEWLALLAEARHRADKAGHYRGFMQQRAPKGVVEPPISTTGRLAQVPR